MECTETLVNKGITMNKIDAGDVHIDNASLNFRATYNYGKCNPQMIVLNKEFLSCTRPLLPFLCSYRTDVFFQTTFCWISEMKIMLLNFISRIQNTRHVS
jgi:hypothetical protein